MQHRSLTVVILILFSRVAFGQAPYIQRGDQAYHTYDRLEILGLTDTTLVNSINNLDKKEVVGFLKTITDESGLTAKDLYDVTHVLSDQYEFLTDAVKSAVQEKSGFEKTGFFREVVEEGDNEADEEDNIFSKDYYRRDPLLKYFYKSRSNFLELETPSFSMYVNPIVQVGYTSQNGNDRTIFQNTRGIALTAYIDKKVYIFSQLLENQRNYTNFVENRISRFTALPGQGYWKSYESGVIGSLKGYDFFNARAYVGFNPVKSINIEFGHGNHFIGNGFRSLLLSDFSSPYFYLKFNTRIWKFQYQNIFAEMSPTTAPLNQGDGLLPKKYTTTHYLAFKPNNRFEIGLFETVVFSREKHFEFQYLNPVILYRAVEHALGSPDNVLLGLNLKWNPVNAVSLYGQFVMDEFKLSEVKERSGWWANKFGGQIGIKYINALGIDHLDLQAEYNAVRPYTYAHRDTLPGLPQYSVANYSNYNQPLAHPLGANFREINLIARYKPTNRIYLQGRMMMTKYGDDRPGDNWGGNILAPLESREMDYGNKIGQGVSTKVMALNLDASYEFFHNYFIDLNGSLRHTTTDTKVNQSYIGGGIRINIANVTYDY